MSIPSSDSTAITAPAAALTTAATSQSSSATVAARLPNVVLFGTGEYTTGYVAGASSTSDKPMGVVALTFFDLRARGLVGNHIALCGRSGRRSAGVREHMRSTIGAYGIDTSCDIHPSAEEDDDDLAYVRLLNSGAFGAGDVAVITTPDSTHTAIARACIERGMSCIIAKPVTQTLQEHWSLLRAADAYYARACASAKAASPPRPLVLCGEYHKRFDPMYSDAIARIQSGSVGLLSYIHAYMSQPKSQLKTFKSWLLSSAAPASSSSAAATTAAAAGTDDQQQQQRHAPSDISYYLNSHHLDTLHLATYRTSYPLWVQAVAAKGCANELFATATETATAAAAAAVDIEDTITITVQYAHSPLPAAALSPTTDNTPPSSTAPTSFGIAVFTSSWIAPRSDVHSQQRFHFLGQKGEVNIDQAHRGYTTATDAAATNKQGLQSVNPLFMRYQPNEHGKFVGQSGYGYKSFEHFIEAVTGRPSTALSPLAHLSSHASLFTTAVLEACRISLDNDNRKVHIVYDEQRRPIALK